MSSIIFRFFKLFLLLFPDLFPPLYAVDTLPFQPQDADVARRRLWFYKRFSAGNAGSGRTIAGGRSVCGAGCFAERTSNACPYVLRRGRTSVVDNLGSPRGREPFRRREGCGTGTGGTGDPSPTDGRQCWGCGTGGPFPAWALIRCSRLGTAAHRSQDVLGADEMQGDGSVYNNQSAV